MKHDSTQAHKRANATAGIIQAICAADKYLVEAKIARDVELALTYITPDVVLHPRNIPLLMDKKRFVNFTRHGLPFPTRKFRYTHKELPWLIHVT